MSRPYVTACLRSQGLYAISADPAVRQGRWA